MSGCGWGGEGEEEGGAHLGEGRVVLAVEAGSVEVPVGRAARVLAQRLHAETLGLDRAEELWDVVCVEAEVGEVGEDLDLGPEGEGEEGEVGVEGVRPSQVLLKERERE